MTSNSFDEYLSIAQEKWAEIPAGSDMSERRFSRDLLRLSDEALVDFWDQEYNSSLELRSWCFELYEPLFKGKRILEIGSGMGYDGVHFLSRGAEWHFSDIVADNQVLIERVCNRKGLSPLGFLTINDAASFERLVGDFDFIWASGSLLHVPFDVAAEECRSIIKKLRPGGRWIELAYPFERWVREGAPPFSEWGRMTDGERTNWAEWYDAEKIRRRLYPNVMRQVLDIRLSSNWYSWVDLVKTGTIYPDDFTQVVLKFTEKIDTPELIWHYAKTIPVDASAIPGPSIDAQIECVILSGSVGFAFLDDDTGKFLGREIVLDSSSLRQKAIISGRKAGRMSLLIRNTSGSGASTADIQSVTLRTSLAV